MALLTVNERKAIFKELGLGTYNKKNIKAFQKKYMLRKSDWDGVYGQNTDNTLRTVYYTKIYCKNFEPEEFRCECGGKYCCGYPSYMKPAELIHIQKIRDHYSKPITVTCGLRCRKQNSRLGGSIQNSLHLKGLAIDFYQKGVTDTLANRKKHIGWISRRKNHHYTYGNGIFRLTGKKNYSGRVSAPYMGNALHTDCYDNVEPKHPKWVEPVKETAPKQQTTEAKEPVTEVKEPVSKPVVKEETWVDKANAWAEKMADDSKAGYRKWSASDKSTHECLICHPETDPKHKWYKYTWNCIGFSFAYLHHGGGLPCKCSCGVLDNSFMTKLLTMDKEKALKELKKKIGLNDIKLIRNGGKVIPQSKMKAGDLCITYDSKGNATHIYPYIGSGYMIDCGNWKDKKKQIAKRKASPCKVIIRYTGDGK